MGKRLYVGNLPYDTDEAALREVFAQDGRTVERVHIVLDRETQRPRGFAFVEMATDAMAQQAIAALDGVMFGVRQLRVTEAEERRPGPGGPGGPRGPGGPPRSFAGGPSSAGPRPYGGGGSGGGAGGGAAGGGAPARPAGDDSRPVNRFGPDARPKREREAEQRRPQRRRVEDTDDRFGGRRGGQRFDDDDE